MSNQTKLFLYIIVSLILTAVVVQPVIQNALTLNSGELFLFPTAPVDPSDPFRGRYVQLSFDQRSAPLGELESSVLEKKVGYGIIEKMSDGSAKISSIVYSRPSDLPYLTLTAKQNHLTYGNERTIDFDFPFDRFYMNEKLAPLAEQIYRENQSSSTPAHLAVRIKNGKGTIEDLLVNGQPIKKLAEDRLKEFNRK